MFLTKLKDENKKKFLQLCVLASQVDGIFSDEEYNVIYAYCGEMQLNKMIPKVEKTSDEILAELRVSTSYIEKKIIIMELIGVFYSDRNINNLEHEYLKKCITALEIKPEDVEDIKCCYERYLVLYNQIENMIFAD